MSRSSLLYSESSSRGGNDLCFVIAFDALTHPHMTDRSHPPSTPSPTLSTQQGEMARGDAGRRATLPFFPHRCSIVALSP